MASSSGPQRLSQALSELISVRGYARVRGDAQLQEAWSGVVGAAIARQTRAVAIRRGVLCVSVASAPLLAELVGFYRTTFLEQFHQRHGGMRIREIRFRLDSGLARPRDGAESPA